MTDSTRHAFPKILTANKQDDSESYLIGDIFNRAASSNKIVAVAVSEDAPDIHKQFAKRRHDIKAAIRTLGFMITAVKSGYTFNDDKATAKIEAIEKAVACLSRESDLLAEVLASEP